jgi:hypothetical protein
MQEIGKGCKTANCNKLPILLPGCICKIFEFELLRRRGQSGAAQGLDKPHH